MQGSLPSMVEAYAFDGAVLVRSQHEARAPASGEVVVEIAGVALGRHPQAEISGRVIAVGSAADAWLGRRVVVPRILPCGDCAACRRGRLAGCLTPARRAGLASHDTLPARFLCSMEPPLWPADAELWALAALADAASAPYGALVRLGIAPGELLIVIGAGPRGLFAAAIAAHKGMTVVVLDADPQRRERAQGAGASLCLPLPSPDPSGVAALLQAATALGSDAGPPRILETTGMPSGRRVALALALGSGGAQLALLDGGRPEEAQVSWEGLAAMEVTVQGCAACHPDLFPELAALLAQGALSLHPWVQPVALEEAGAAHAAGPEASLLPILRLSALA